MIVLHILGADFALSRYLAARLADRGIAALFVKLPYYGERRPPGESEAISLHGRRTVDRRDAPGDLRRPPRGGVACQPARDRSGPAGITGISLGGIVSSVAAAVDPTLNRAVFLLAGGDLARILWEMPEAAKYRALWIESGKTLADLKTLTDPYDPLTYAHRLVGKRLLMIAGNVDEVVPPTAPASSGRRPADRRSSGTTAGTIRPWPISCPPCASPSNSSPPTWIPDSEPNLGRPRPRQASWSRGERGADRMRRCAAVPAHPRRLLAPNCQRGRQAAVRHPEPMKMMAQVEF